MPLRKTEKTILWILVLSILIWQGYRIWRDWPVYASPMSVVDSFDELEEYLEQSGRTFVLPEPFWEDDGKASYEIGLDGRTRKARATGYSIGVNCDGIQKGVSFSYIEASIYPAEIRSESYAYETYKAFYSACDLGPVRITASAMVPRECLAGSDGEELERSMQEWTYTHCKELVEAYLQIEPEAASIAMPEMLQSFLDGEALLERARPLSLQKYREPYTLAELAQGWQDSLAEQNIEKPLTQTNYALVDFMEDGEPELALRFMFGEEEDACIVQTVLKESDGVLREVMSCTGQWEINPYGFFRESSCLDGTLETEIDGGFFRTDLGPYGGEKVICYEEIRYSGLPQPYIPFRFLMGDSVVLQDLPPGYPQDIAREERTGPYTLHIYYLSNPKGVWPTWPFYAFSKEEDGTEHPTEPQASYREWYRSAGIDIRTMDEVAEGIIACYETFGIAADHWNDPPIEWIPL